MYVNDSCGTEMRAFIYMLTGIAVLMRVDNCDATLYMQTHATKINVYSIVHVHALIRRVT